MVTAGTEIMHGRSQQVARGLNTIAGRVAKNSDALKQYGVSVNDSNGNLRSTYDILGDLKPKWDKMSNAQKVSLGNTLAGVNQYKVFAAVMGNYGKAQEATTTALNSSGSAAKENKKQIESLQGKINELKAAFTELVLGDGGVIDLVKGIIDAGTAILKFANSDVGGAIIETGLLAVSFALISTKVIGTVSALSTLNKALKTLGIIGTIKNWNNLAGAIAEVGVVSTTVEGAVGGTAVAATGASAAFAGLLTTLAPFLIGGAVLTGLYALAKWEMGKPTKELKKAQTEFDKLSNKQQTYQSELDSLKSKNGNLTQTEKARLKYLEAQTAEIKKQIALKAEQVTNKTVNKFQYTGDKKVTYSNHRGGTETHTIKVTYKGHDAVKKATSDILKYSKGANKSSEAQVRFVNKNKKVVSSLQPVYQAYQKQIASGKKLTKSQEAEYNSIQEAIAAYKAQGGKADWAGGKVDKLAEKYAKKANKVKKSAKKVSEANKEESNSSKKTATSVSKSQSDQDKSRANSAKNAHKYGGQTTANYISGLKSKQGDAEKAGESLGKSTKTGIALVDYVTAGINAAAKFIAGIFSGGSSSGSKGSGSKGSSNKSGHSAEGGESSGGMTLVNEEGAELIDTGDGAYVAGGGQPTLVNLKKGDYVYTADESAGMGVTSNGSYRTRKKGTSKSKAKSRASKNLENLSYKLDMDLISEKTYYSKLAKLNKKYYKQKLIDSDTYKDNLKSIHDYQNELVKDNLDKKLDALATESGYTTKNQKNYLAYLKKLKKQHKISTEEYKEYYQQYNKTVADHYADAYKDGTMTYDQLMTKLKAFVKAGKITWADYYSYVDDANEEAKEKYEDALNDQQNKLDVQQTVMEWYADQQKKVIENQITALENEKQLIEDEKSATDEAEQLAELQQNLIDAQNTKIKVFQDGEWKYVQNANSVKEAQDALDDFNEERAYNKRIEAIDNQIDALQDESDAWDTYVSNYEDLQTKLLNEQTLGMTYEQYIQNSRITNLETFNAAFEKLVNEQVAIAKKLADIENNVTNKTKYIVTQGKNKGTIIELTDTQIKNLGGNYIIAGLGPVAPYNPTKGYASGSSAIPFGGTYRFNENGDELSIPPNLNYAPAGTGIIPHTMTENLKEIGMHSWGEIERGVSNSDNHSVNINSMTVKADDPRDFLRQMKNLVNINN